jgi:hypothetical protein
MGIIQTESNRGNKAILVEGILYRKKNVLKNGDIVYVCSAENKCTKSITKMDYLLQRNAADILLKSTCDVNLLSKVSIIFKEWRVMNNVDRGGVIVLFVL